MPYAKPADYPSECISEMERNAREIEEEQGIILKKTSLIKFVSKKVQFHFEHIYSSNSVNTKSIYWDRKKADVKMGILHLVCE